MLRLYAGKDLAGSYLWQVVLEKAVAVAADPDAHVLTNRRLIN